MHEKEGLKQDHREDFPSEGWKPHANHPPGSAISARLSIPIFTTICRNEVPTACAFGFAQLALLYALINNTV
jgi:hypothetical protein